jgi:hypothetical protein
MHRALACAHMEATKARLNGETVQGHDHGPDPRSRASSVNSDRLPKMRMPLLMALGITACGAPAMDDTSELLSSEEGPPAAYTTSTPCRQSARYSIPRGSPRRGSSMRPCGTSSKTDRTVSTAEQARRLWLAEKCALDGFVPIRAADAAVALHRGGHRALTGRWAARLRPSNTLGEPASRRDTAPPAWSWRP